MDYEIRRGDCLSSIARAHAIFWQDIWEHPNNAALRARRRDPNILFPGDRLFLPVFQPYAAPRPTGAMHRFRCKGEETVVRLRLCFLEQPRANEPCTVLAGERRLARTTDATGLVTFPVPRDLPACTLVFDEGAEDEERILVQLGDIDPACTVTGMQGRLRNLGYYGGAIDGMAGPLTRAAAAEYCRVHKLQEAPGSAGFAAHLARIHGN